MGWTVFRLEWRILRRDRAAVVVIALFGALLLLAAAAGGRHAADTARGQVASRTEERARLERFGADIVDLARTGEAARSKDPRDPAWVGREGGARVAQLPLSPLASVAVGQRELHPQSLRVTTGAHLTAERETETPMAGPTRQRSGAFDPAFLFVVLFPLLIIALAYELLTGERERGTLAMLLSQPVTQTQLVLGKAGARAMLLSVVTLAFVFISLLVGGAELSSPRAWLHAALYGLVIVAWGVFWFAAAIAVNARGRTSARNALVLVGVWLVLVVVVPGLLQVAVHSAHPPPSRLELLHHAREATRDVERELQGLVGRHDVDPRKQGFGQRVARVQRELGRRSAPVLAEMRERLDAHQGMLDDLRFLSPAMIVQHALEDVAGSGAGRQRRFSAQVEAFHESYRAFFFERVDAGRALVAADLAAIPEMTFEEEPLGALIGRVVAGALVLFLAAAFLIATAWPALRRVGRLAS